MSIGQTRFDTFQQHYQDFIFDDDVKEEIVCRFNTDMGYRRLNSAMYHIKKCPEECLLERFEHGAIYTAAQCSITIHEQEDNKKRVVWIEYHY